MEERDVVHTSSVAVLVVLAGLCLQSIALAEQRVFHVAPDGDDSGPATAERPWASVDKAAAEARAGDTVVLRGGTYMLKAPLRLTGAGQEDAWITIKGAQGETPVLDAGSIQTADGRGRLSTRGAVQVDGATYLRLKNLHVRESYGAGFAVTGRNTQHIELIGCSSDHSYAPGFWLYQSQDLRVIGCEVTRSNDLRMAGEGATGRREAPHEALSIAGVQGFEVAYCRVHRGYKEAIDCKENSAHGKIHHNECYDMPRQGLYVDAWFGTLEDVELYENTVHDCEFGVAVAVEGRGANMRNVSIHNNVIYRNRASGIFLAMWGTDGPRENIRIYNNTVCNNGRAGHWSGSVGGIDVRSADIKSVLIANNISVGNFAYDRATFAAPEGRQQALAEKGIVIAGNMTGPFQEQETVAGQFPRPYPFRGEQTVEGDPRFVLPRAADFRLLPGSPAIGAAVRIEGVPYSPDIGAFQTSAPAG